MSNKNNDTIFNWSFFILSTLGLIFAIVVCSNEVQKLFAENEAKIIDELYTEKGMYYGPSYYVKFTDGNDHRISKKDYVLLEEGDTYQVFLNNVSFQDLMIYTIVAIVILSLLSLCSYIFAWEALGHMKWFNKIMRPLEKIKHAIKSHSNEDKCKRLVSIVLIAICLLTPLTVMKNAIHKLNPLGKTAVGAEIIDRETYRPGGRFRGFIRYTITYEYVDESGHSYISEKNVSRRTYKRYENKQSIPIVYRDKNPYDTFNTNQTFTDYFFFIFLNLRHYLIVVSLLIGAFFIREYQKTWGCLFERVFKKNFNKA